MTTRRILIATAATAALVTALAATHAQQQIIGGRALDSSLQQGSAGFNTTRTGLHTPTYQGYRGSNVRARQNPAQHQNYANTQNAYRTAAPRVTYSTGGTTAVATRGATGGFNTLGNTLSTPSYSPLSTGVRVQRAPQTTAVYQPPRTTYPTYSSPSYTPPSYPNTSYSASGRASIPSYTPSPTTSPGLAGLAQPTYSTLRVGP